MRAVYISGCLYVVLSMALALLLLTTGMEHSLWASDYDFDAGDYDFDTRDIDRDIRRSRRDYDRNSRDYESQRSDYESTRSDYESKRSDYDSSGSGSRRRQKSSSSSSGLVNINSATQHQLDELPNIGPSRARAIISHREQYGPFKRIEDIMNVHGIGKGIFAGMKDSITVDAPVETSTKVAEEKAVVEPPKIYEGKNCVRRSCWNCKNSFYVPEELKKGWCPFCGKKWSLQ